jgi:hypothetical protein
MERYIDNCGNQLHKKFSFLENFKNFKTLLFVDLNDTNNNYYAFIINKDLLYIINIEYNYTLQECIKLNKLKKYLINNDELKNNNIKKIFKNMNKINIHLLNVVNDWINDIELKDYKKYSNNI